MMANKALLLALMLALTAALSAVPVAAQEPVPDLALVVEPESAVGKEIAVEAYLLDPAGNPVQGEVVTFLLDVEFLNNFGKAEIGQTITDEDGRALLVHILKQDGEQTITARFAGNNVFAAAEVSTSLSVAPGPATYEEEPLFRIPGANITVVVIVLATTWGLLLMVMGLLWLIGHAGDESSEAEATP